MSSTAAVLFQLAMLAGLAANSWISFLNDPILPADDRQSMMFSYVDRHLPAIEIPTTKDAWERAKGPLREQILKLVGLTELQKRGPVRWIGKGRIDRDTYSIEKILFESYPGMWVPALVYLPKGLTDPAPAMISIAGHAYCEGKASDFVQARSVNLARRGIIALAYDYIDTGERNTGANACASMPYGGGNDHGLKAFSYTVGTPTGLEILDGIRAVDYLYSRPDVDRSRIGFTGESGGSNTTYWVSALDERVRLAVPVCSVTTFDYWIRNDRNWDWHQRPPGIRRVADIPILLALTAPRPLLVIGSLRGTDSQEFPFDQTEEAVRRASWAYELYGARQNIEIWESNTAHGYQQDKRERMYGFVERHFLRRQNAESHELAFLLEPQHDLDCGLPQGNKTFADIYSDWVASPTPLPAMPDSQATAKRTQAKLRDELRDLLGIAEQPAHPRLSVQAIATDDDVLLRRLIVEPEEGIRLPVVEIQTRGSSPARLVILPGKSGWPTAAVSALLSAGLTVALVDLRGTGEMQSGGGRTNNWAWFMGRPWTGMWVSDISAVAAAFSAEHPDMTIGIIGTGDFAKSALFAAALDPRIGACIVRLEKPAYRDEVLTGELSEVPRILAVTDLPGVAAMVVPRPCRLEHPPELSEQFREAYAWPAEFSARGFGSTALQLQPQEAPEWNGSAAWLVHNLR